MAGGRTNLRGAAHLCPSADLARGLAAAAPRLAALRALDFTLDDAAGLSDLAAALAALGPRLEALTVRSARLFNASRRAARGACARALGWSWWRGGAVGGRASAGLLHSTS